jgi:hypothetical protein
MPRRIYAGLAPLFCNVRWKSAALVVLLASVLATPPIPSFAQAARVSITINSVNNHGCFDRIGLVCTKPDMMVRVAVLQSDGTQIPCPDTVPIKNYDNIGPLASCSGVLAVTPFDLLITLYDVDENKLPGIFVQEQIRLSEWADGGSATIPWFRLGGGAVTIAGPDANLTFTPTVTMVAPKFLVPSLQLTTSSIDPQLGDRVIASGTIFTSEAMPQPYPGTVKVRWSFRSSSTGPTEIATVSVPANHFNLDWDGKVYGGPSVSPGTYFLDATILETGETATAAVQVVSLSRTFHVTRSPSTPWNPQAGPVSFDVRINPGGSITSHVEGPSVNGMPCTVGSLPVPIPDTVITGINAGSGSLPIKLVTPAGKSLSAGDYCVRFSAKDNAGTAIGDAALELKVIDPPPLRLFVTLDPPAPWLFPLSTAPDATGAMVPVPSVPVAVEARTLDGDGQPRPTGSITVRAIPGLDTPISPSTVTSLTCNSVSVCRVPIGLTTITTATAANVGVVFEAAASDIGGDPTPKTGAVGPRAASLSFSATVGAGGISLPAIGDLTTGFMTPPRSRTQDVVFHAGTGISLQDQSQTTLFNSIIKDVLKVFFGGDAFVGANSVTADQGQSIAFFVTPAPAVVTTTAAWPDFPDWPLCDRSHVVSVPWADIQAIIHNVNCRDNSDGNDASFSASAAGAAYTAWHEFHHAAYDLADEYPGGSHWQNSVCPNNMSDATQCATKGAEPLLCSLISNTSWWRAAPTPDVMIDNTRENKDDLCRASLIQNICKTNGC